MTSNMWPDTRQGNKSPSPALKFEIKFHFKEFNQLVVITDSERHPVSRSRGESLLVERKPRVSTGTSVISIEKQKALPIYLYSSKFNYEPETKL